MNVEKLILKGYFPEEITPAFVTDDLKSVLPDIIKNLDAYDPIGKKGRICKLLNYSTPKIKAYRRNIVVPNPLSIIRLAKTICDHWNLIIGFTSKSSISLSPLKESESSARAIVQPSFDNITRQRILRSTGYRFALKIDILRFYGNIYTHSIPWALHGKNISKSKRQRLDLLGNALDEDIRKMQDGQTIGIPIGPDTSRVISEIIVSHIDFELEKQLGKITGLRVVDDYTLFFKNLGELETARSIILKLLREFELDLNQAKESVIELPEQIENEWYKDLKEFKFRNDTDYQYKDVIAYFDLAFFYSKKFPSESVLTYSLSKISATVFKKGNWELIESFLLKSIFIEPKVLPHIVRMFISHQAEGYDLNNNLIKTVLEDFLSFHLNLENHFEVAWVLWLFKHLKIEVSEFVANLISKSNNSIIILTALDVYYSGLIPSGLDLKDWNKLLNAENLYTEHWLVVYEALKKGWLKSSTNFINKDPFFKLLLDNDVEFYKEDIGIDISKMKVASDDVSLLKFRDEDDADEDLFMDLYDGERYEEDHNLDSEKDNADNPEVIDDLPF